MSTLRLDTAPQRLRIEYLIGAAPCQLLCGNGKSDLFILCWIVKIWWPCYLLFTTLLNSKYFLNPSVSVQLLGLVTASFICCVRRCCALIVFTRDRTRLDPTRRGVNSWKILPTWTGVFFIRILIMTKVLCYGHLLACEGCERDPPGRAGRMGLLLTLLPL